MEVQIGSITLPFQLKACIPTEEASWVEYAALEWVEITYGLKTVIVV